MSTWPMNNAVPPACATPSGLTLAVVRGWAWAHRVRSLAQLRALQLTLGLALCLVWPDAAAQAANAPAPAGRGVAAVLDIRGAIGPATSRQVSLGLEDAQRTGARVVVLRLDTPGGLDASMREIVSTVLASPLPVLAFVGPPGARAASAGTFIVYASHLAAMAPGTHLGAATPVALGGGGSGAERDEGAASAAEPAKRAERRSPALNKATNDAAAYIRSLAAMRGRNADWGEHAVREAASLPAAQALEQQVIELMAPDIPALLQQADGREVQLATGRVRLQTVALELRPIATDWRTHVLSVLANPNLALLLMMIGVYGLLFEFMSPGALFPGVAGAIALCLGLYALAVLPLNAAGAALLVLGMALLVGEAFVPSFGILGLGGVLAFVIGAGMLFDGGSGDAALLGLSLPLIASIGLAALAASMLVLRLAWRTRSLRSSSGGAALEGQPAKVLDWADGSPVGHVLLAGERWQAHGEVGLRTGQSVWVVAVHGLHVQVSARSPANAAFARSNHP